MGGSFNPNHLVFLLTGAFWTVALTLMSFVSGGVLGFVVALCRVSPLRPLRWVVGAYILLIQGTPLLVLIFLLYFGVAMGGIETSPLLAADLALTIYASAFLGEIWRGCIESVPRAQWEAAECLPLTRMQRMRLVVLPQAVKIAAPPTAGFLVQIVKNSSLASVVGFVELTRAGQLVNNSIFEPFLVFVIVAGLYFILCFPLSYLSRRFEARSNIFARVPPE